MDRQLSRFGPWVDLREYDGTARGHPKAVSLAVAVLFFEGVIRKAGDNMFWPAFPFRGEVLSDPVKEFDRRVATLMNSDGITRETALTAVRRKYPDLNREYLVAINPEMREWIVSQFAGCGTWQPGHIDGEYYAPTSDDLAAIRRMYPTMEAERPDWRRILTDLVEGGRDHSYLLGLTPREIIGLLGDGGKWSAPMTKSAAARRLKVSTKTLRRWIDNPSKSPYRIEEVSRQTVRIYIKK